MPATHRPNFRVVCDALPVDDRLASAVLDNARWCDTICTALGQPGRFETDAWVSPIRTPRGYPDAVTLVMGASADRVVARIDSSPGSSVKDSFADVDLSGHGFRILFEASWLWRNASASAAGDVTDPIRWHRVQDAVELGDWGAVHGGGALFSPTLLELPSVHVLSAEDPNGQRIAGSIATVGTAAVGISNTFATTGATTVGGTVQEQFARVFRSATAAIQAAFPNVPIVGYLDADRVGVALAAGYEITGRLRVWVRD